jgi:hypothetical protein
MVQDDADWKDRYKLQPVVEETPDEDPTTYPSGTTLLVERGNEHEVVRVGGLFSDTDLTILRSMQPMSDTSGWIVKEVL